MQTTVFVFDKFKKLTCDLVLKIRREREWLSINEAAQLMHFSSEN